MCGMGCLLLAICAKCDNLGVNCDCRYSMRSLFAAYCLSNSANSSCIVINGFDDFDFGMVMVMLLVG
jgi:hypothetical protein